MSWYASSLSRIYGHDRQRKEEDKNSCLGEAHSFEDSYQSARIGRKLRINPPSEWINVVS